MKDSSIINDVFFYKNQKLQIEDISCDNLIQTYGTPIMVYSKKRLIDNIDSLKKAFLNRYPKTKFMFAYKGCYLPNILGIIKDNDVGAEVTSSFEYLIAKKNGIKDNNIVWNSPSRSINEIETLLDNPCYWNVDSIEEAKKINSLAQKENKVIKIGLRVHPSVEIGNSYIERGGKLGLDVASGQALKACRIISKMDNIELTGIHCHSIVENNLPIYHSNIINGLIDFACLIENELNIKLEYISPGGGFNTRREMEQLGYSIDDFARLMCSAFDKLNYNPTLILEPGRYIINDAALSIGKIINKKMCWKKNWWITDLGTSLLIPFNGREFDVYPIQINNTEKICANIGDRTSSFTGVIKRNAILCEQSINDYIVAIDCGGYTFSCAQNYMYPVNSKIILVDQTESKIIYNPKDESQIVEELFEQMV